MTEPSNETAETVHLSRFRGLIDEVASSVRSHDPVRVTTPEGWTIELQIETRISAMQVTDKDGNSLPVTLLSEMATGSTARRKVTCWACVQHPGGRMCYEISCDALPKPGVMETIE